MEQESTTTEALPPPPPLPPKRLTKRKDAGWINGVAAGIGAYFDIDPLFVRIAFVAFSFVGGLGIVAYAAGMLLLPVATDAEIAAKPIAPSSYSGPGSNRDWHPGTGRIIAFIIAVAAVMILAGSLDLEGPGILLAVLLIAAGFYFLSDAERAGDLRASMGRGSKQTSPDVSAPTAVYAAAPGSRPETATPVWTSEMAAEHEARKAERRAARRERRLLRNITLGVALLVTGVIISLAFAGTADVGFRVGIACVLFVLSAGIMVGAWRGRPGSLVVIALLLTPFALGSAAADDVFDEGGGDRVWVPVSAVDLQSEYRHGAGHVVLDLRNIRLAENETRVVDAALGIGEMEIILPEGVSYELTGEVGLGDVAFSDDEQEGVGSEDSIRAIIPGTGKLEIDAHVGVGRIETATRNLNLTNPFATTTTTTGAAR